MGSTAISDKRFLLDRLNDCLLAIGDSHNSTSARHHIQSFCILLGHQGDVDLQMNYSDDHSFPWGEETLQFFSNYPKNVRGAIQAIVDSSRDVKISDDDDRPFCPDIPDYEEAEKEEVVP